jgi:hypothetical protein
MLSSAQFRETPVSTASGSLSVHQGSSICSLPSNWFRSISSASGRRSESIGIYRLNFRAIQAETERGPRGSAFPEIGNYADFLGLNVSVFRISMIITRSDLPKIASNNRHAGTPEENKAFEEGSIAYFGTYSAKQMTCAIHIESSTFPNWIGTNQKRSFIISGD